MILQGKWFYVCNNVLTKLMVSAGVFGCSVLLTAGIFVSEVAGEEAYGIEWVKQYGTANHEYGKGVAVDGLGNVYVGGYTDPQRFTGLDSDYIFLVKYDSAGNLLWDKSFDASDYDKAYDVAADGFGNVFVAGATRGIIGGSSSGGKDAFWAKYDTHGNMLRAEQLGTISHETFRSITVDGFGNAYVSGSTYGDIGGVNAGKTDAFLAKYDLLGNLQWTEQLGTVNSDSASGVAVDGFGNVFISGQYNGIGGIPNVDSSDIFIAKYNSSGVRLWNKQLGTSLSDGSNSIVVDSQGNVYISGWTHGDLGGTLAGDSDAYLTKYSPEGNLLWTEQFGTSEIDNSLSLAIDGNDSIFISGWTLGSIGGVNAGVYDAYLAKYDTSGNLLWIEQYGTSEVDKPYSVAVDGAGNVFVSGYTEGDLGGVNAGESDVFVIKFAVPEPGSLGLLAVGGVMLLRRKLMICV